MYQCGATSRVSAHHCSGHGAMKENYYLDDGTYSASQIIIIMVKRALEGLGKDIYSSLLKDLKEPMESSEFRLKLKVRIQLSTASCWEN